jgi:hypothetical protein
MVRTRGASAWLYSSMPGVGWLVVGLLTAALLPRLGFASGTGVLTNGGTFIATVVPGAYVGLLALYVRFRIGRGVEGPSGSWSCPHCHAVNQSYALKCDSCGESFSTQRAGSYVATHALG